MLISHNFQDGSPPENLNEGEAIQKVLNIQEEHICHQDVQDIQEEGPPPQKRQRTDFEAINFNEIYPDQSEAFYFAMNHNLPSFVDNGIMWNRIQYPLLKENDTTIKDYRSGNVMQVNLHPTEIFFTTQVKENIDHGSDHIIKADKAFMIIRDELSSCNYAQAVGNDAILRGRTLQIHPELELNFLDSFFEHLNSNNESYESNWALKWREATPAVVFLFDENIKIEETISEIFNHEELHIGATSIALGITKSPKINKDTILEELEKRRSVNVHMSTIVGMNMFSTLKEYSPFKALIKNALYILTRLFSQWHHSKTALRKEFLADFDPENVFYGKLLNASPLCAELFPSALMEEIKKFAEFRVMSSDQLLKMRQSGFNKASHFTGDNDKRFFRKKSFGKNRVPQKSSFGQKSKNFKPRGSQYKRDWAYYTPKNFRGRGFNKKFGRNQTPNKTYTYGRNY